MSGMSFMSKDVRSNQNDLARGFRLPVDQPFLRNALELCVFGAAFYFAYSHGMCSFSQVSASPFWIPDSILLCALLMSPPRRWWIFVLAPLPIRLFVGATQNFPLGFFLSNVKQQLQNGGNATVQNELTRLQQRTVDLADVIRNLSHELHPGVLQHVGLAAALNGHCAEVGRQHPIEVTFSAVDGLNGIPDDVALCLYRVAQEALRNIAEHAAAHKAQISLRSNDEGLELVIADDGQGFDLAEAQRLGGLGLISLDERVRLIGGSLAISTEPQRGTEMRVQVPLGGNR